MMSRRYFLLFLWTHTGLWLNYTPLKNEICTCFWEPDRIILQRSFLYQSWKKVPCLWFQHFCCRFIKNCLNTEEKEQCWEQGKDLNSKSRAKRSRGTRSKNDLYVGSKKDPLLSTTAARPAFFQGYAIYKAAVGSPVLLSLAVCCLFWLLHCLVSALPVTTNFFTDWSYKGVLWLWHANDCLGHVQFSDGTPGASQFVSKVMKSYWVANVSGQN